MADLPQFDESAFRRMVELAPDAMIAHGQGRIVWANDAAAVQMGVASAAAMVGMPVLDFVAPESRPVVLERIRRMHELGESMPLVEETFLRTDGTRLAVETAASPIGGGVVLVVVRDITARRAAQREQRLAETRARAFFETTTEAMGISRKGVHVEVNAAYARMFGYQGPEQLVGVPIFDLLDPDEHPRITANVQARARGEAAPSVFAVRARRRDGAPFLIDVHAAAYPEGDGWTTVVVMRDVTAQREAEARVADSERRYRELFDQVPVGVWEEDLSGVKAIVDGLRARGVTDFHEHFRKHPQDAAACAAAARVLAVNATVCRMAGAIDSAQLLANLERVIPPESLPSFVAAVADMAQGKPVTTSEGWNNTLDGRRVWVSMRAALASGREHDWSRLVVTTTDMTERLQAREEREALQDRLRHSEKLEAIGRLAGGVAHDFNNLLAAIMAHTELALIEAPPGASSMVDSLNVIQEASLRARDLVRQILTFGRKDRPRPEPLDLEKVVTDALVLARTAVPATVALSTRVHRAGVVLADRTQLHQIVLNLCANARDAVAGNGHIDVELDQVTVGAEVPELKGRSCARLRVRDDGIGMDEATRARLFEPYMTTRAHVGGHGLGLAVVHGIVTSAGGAIAVDSAPGAGSTFDVYLPNVEELPPVAVNPRRASGGHERILLVDDEPLVLSAHRRLLSSLGYAVTVAYDAEQALKQLRASPGAFDLVISDQSMPRMSGFELARALLSEQPRARVMLVTGFSDEVDDARAREHGLKGVLLKPLSREVFDAAIRAALA